jgi:hypothetical protein
MALRRILMGKRYHPAGSCMVHCRARVIRLSKFSLKRKWEWLFPKNEGQRGLSEMACLGYMVIPQPMVEVRCSVCGNQSYEVICTPARVKADLEYVRRFHRRRLRPTKNG